MRSKALPYLVLFGMVMATFIPLYRWTAPASATQADAASVAAPASGIEPTGAIALTPLGTYQTGLYDEGAQEIAAYDPVSRTLFVVNAQAATVDIIDISEPMTPTRTAQIDATAYGSQANSVDVLSGIVAVAVENEDITANGSVVFFDRDGDFLKQVTVGVLPDMVTFSPDGQHVLTANEGQPNDDYTVDPEGSVSVIDISGGVATATVTTLGFTHFNGVPLDPRIRIFGPGSTASQDLEPEYIAVSADSTRAWVTLQENNALGVINLETMTVTQLIALGYKDHNLPGWGLDASNQDDAINIANWPVRGMYMPDGIAAYEVGGNTYLVTANEGDARDYKGFSEQTRVADLVLDPAIFPNAAALQENEALGRLLTTTATGDLDGDNVHEAIYAFGGRSFTIWNAAGKQLYDSGDSFERITAGAFPEEFNSNNAENDTFDNRSDDKGPEPEGVTLGEIGGRTYAFVGLERIGGVMVYDVTNPSAPTFVQYVNPRDFTGDAEADTAGDLGPEGILFIPGTDSPTGAPLLVVANEVSGSTTVYGIGSPDGAGTLTLLHNNDGESSLLPIGYSVEPNSGYPNTDTVQLDVGSVAAFKTVTDEQIAAARAADNSVVNVYAGDAFLASATLVCSLPPNPADTPIYDAVAQRQIAYDAHIFGNHEFDYSPDFLERFVRAFEVNGVLTQPFLSSNLDFSGEPGFADLIDQDGIIVGYSTDGRVVARSMISVDETTGQRFGIVGATTPTLPTISSPRNVGVTETVSETAQLAQAEIDRLYNQYGVRKIIFVSHLQDVNNDVELVGLLSRVDIAVAGGGDELLVNSSVPTDTQLLPGEAAPIVDEYPVRVTDATSRTVYLVTTAGNYKYLGRLDVEFDAAGEIASFDAQQSYPRRVIPESATATTLGLDDAVMMDAGIVETVNEPVEACLEGLAEPIARTEVALDVSRNSVRSRESNGGNLIADSFLYVYEQYADDSGLEPRSETNPVIAVQNGGGIRQNAGDELEVGTISRLDTINVLPFDNFMTVVRDVTPADLKTILERSAASLPGQGGQFLQIAGFRVTYGTSYSVGNRVREVTLDDGTEDGTAIIRGGAVVADAPAVDIVTNGFTANGGDNYPTFAANPNKTRLLDDSGISLAYEQSFRLYLQTFPVEGDPALPTVQADDERYQPGGEGRITITAGVDVYLPLILQGSAR